MEGMGRPDPFAEPSANDWYLRNGDVHCRRKSRPDWAQANRSFERLEKSAGGVPEEEFALSDVTRQHRVRGVPGLLPDLER